METRKKRKMVSTEIEKEMFKLSAAGFTLDEISKKLNFSKPCISKHLKGKVNKRVYKPIRNVSNAIKKGLACSECTIYFNNANSHPVLCRSCYNTPRNKARRHFGKPCLPLSIYEVEQPTAPVDSVMKGAIYAEGDI